MVLAAAARYPTRAAVIDDDGPFTYRELDQQASQFAAFLLRTDRRGAVGILCRNHRGFLVAQTGAERAGSDVVMLNTALPAARLAEVVERENITTLVADDEFSAVPDSVAVISADGIGPRSLKAGSSAACRWVPSPSRRSGLVLLTSGTTGAPRGAKRPNRALGTESLSILEQIPYQVGDVYHVASPLFHAWGLSQVTIALATASTVILRRKFDAEAVVDLLESEALDVLAVVPLMLRRILFATADADAAGRVLHAPRIVTSSGNVLSGDLSLDWMDRFGDRLFNLYGSTETGMGTIARPLDMRIAPGTVGRPPKGVTLSILDEDGMPLPPGQTGAIFLSSTMQFAGYSDGTDRVRNGSLMESNDLGYLDDRGLLHVNGRAGDMIVTGGENVFPSAVEEVLERQPGVEAACVVGLPNPEYGQIVGAFIVVRDGETVDPEALRTELAKEMPGYMVPREYRFVEGLPMTTTGKVIRHQLAVLGQAEHL